MSTTVQRLARRPAQEAIKSYLRYAGRFTARTQQHYKMVVWRFYKCMPLYAADLTVEHIELYLDSIKATNRTKNAHLTAIKSFCGYLHDYLDLPNKAAKIKMLPEDPPKRRWLTPEEVDKILAVCNENERKIILLLCHTGLRASELQSLQPNNFNAELTAIRFCGKGRKVRVVPLNSTSLSCITVCNELSLNFLMSYRKRNALYGMCKRLSVKAGAPVAGPHSYRRFFATSLVKKGVSIYHVSKLLGHADVRTTEIYLSCSDDELIGCTDVLD